MKLKEKELNKVFEFIDKYGDLNIRMQKIENQIKDLHAEKHGIVESISNGIDNYGKIEDRIEELHEKTYSLEKDKNILILELESIRNDELKFGKSLEKKYGKGRFNFKTLEYESISENMEIHNKS